MTNESRVTVSTDDPPRLRLADAPDLATDLLGIPPDGLVRLPPVPTALAFRIRLAASDGPYGPVDVEVLARGDGSITSGTWHDLPRTEHDPMSITGAYLMLLGWLHDEVIFGHLLWAGADVKGDLIDYAALDGIVSARPGPRPEAELVAAMIADCVAGGRGDAG